jgi:hypothetical protein
LKETVEVDYLLAEVPGWTWTQVGPSASPHFTECTEHELSLLEREEVRHDDICWEKVRLDENGFEDTWSTETLVIDEYWEETGPLGSG